MRKATVVYCTHILDGLSGWPTHHMHMHQGRVVAFGAYPLEVPEVPQHEAVHGSSLYKQVQALLQRHYPHHEEVHQVEISSRGDEYGTITQVSGDFMPNEMQFSWWCEREQASSSV
jgi:ABC-type uncharacterized transport system ATPase subunit